MSYQMPGALSSGSGLLVAAIAVAAVAITVAVVGTLLIG